MTTTTYGGYTMQELKEALDWYAAGVPLKDFIDAPGDVLVDLLAATKERDELRDIINLGIEHTILVLQSRDDAIAERDRLREALRQIATASRCVDRYLTAIGSMLNECRDIARAALNQEPPHA